MSADTDFGELLAVGGVSVQLRAELAAAPSRRVMHQLWVEGGRHEIDLAIDLGRGRVLAIEVRAGAAPARDDARRYRLRAIWICVHSDGKV